MATDYRRSKILFLKKANRRLGRSHDLSEAFFKKKNALMQRILALVSGTGTKAKKDLILVLCYMRSMKIRNAEIIAKAIFARR